MLARYGIRVAPLAFDTMLAEWVLDPGSRNLGLKNMAAARLGEAMTHIEDLIGTGKNQLSMAEVAIAEAAPYAAADAETTLRLKPLLETELKRFPKLWDLFVNIEMPLIPVLADMEMAGIALDKDFFASFLGGTERAPGRHSNSRSTPRSARPSTSTPPSSFPMCSSAPCAWPHPTGAERPPPGIIPPRQACWMN